MNKLKYTGMYNSLSKKASKTIFNVRGLMNSGWKTTAIANGREGYMTFAFHDGERNIEEYVGDALDSKAWRLENKDRQNAEKILEGVDLSNKTNYILSAEVTNYLADRDIYLVEMPIYEMLNLEDIDLKKRAQEIADKHAKWERESEAHKAMWADEQPSQVEEVKTETAQA